MPPFTSPPPLRSDLGFDAEDFVADVHAVDDGSFVRVFGDEVLIEEADCVLARCRGESDQMRIEILQNLAPDAVDGSMAFIDDDEVEELNGQGIVIHHFA